MDEETRQRILVEALTQQAERYRAKARFLMHVHAQKGGQMTAINEQCRLAAQAETMRDQIKEG